MSETAAMLPSEAEGTRRTLLHGTKLPLATWHRAARLMARERPVRLRELQAACGVSYKTAWRMRRILTDAVIASAEHSSRMQSLRGV